MAPGVKAGDAASGPTTAYHRVAPQVELAGILLRLASHLRTKDVVERFAFAERDVLALPTEMFLHSRASAPSN